jgi:anti-sigma factor RsiW
MGYMDMKRLFTSCGKQRQPLSLLAAGVLTASERAAAEAHLAACTDCRRYFEEIRTLSRTLSSWSQATPDMEPTPAWHDRWTRSIHSEKRKSAWQPIASQASMPTPSVTWWQALLTGRRGALAGLAGVWMLTLFFWLTAPEVSQTASQGALPAPRELIQAFMMRERLLSQWPAIPNAAPENKPVDRPPKTVPSPRSDYGGKILVG